MSPLVDWELLHVDSELQGPWTGRHIEREGVLAEHKVTLDGLCLAPGWRVSLRSFHISISEEGTLVKPLPRMYLVTMTCPRAEICQLQKAVLPPEMHWQPETPSQGCTSVWIGLGPGLHGACGSTTTLGTGRLTKDTTKKSSQWDWGREGDGSEPAHVPALTYGCPLSSVQSCSTVE